MKAYFEPKMNIAVFDAADVVTTSGGIEQQFNKGGENKTFGSMSYRDLPTQDSVNATMSN